MWYSRSAVVGGPGQRGAAAIQSANVTPGGTSQLPSRPAHAQQLGVEHPPGPRRRPGRPAASAGGAVRCGSSASQRPSGRTSSPCAARAAPASSRTPRPAPGPARAPPPSGGRRRRPRRRRRTPARRRWSTSRCGPTGRSGRSGAPSRGSAGGRGRGAAAAADPRRAGRRRGRGRRGGVCRRLGVGGDGADEGAEGGQRRAGQLHLATGFDGDRGATRQGAGRGARGPARAGRAGRARCAAPRGRAGRSGGRRWCTSHSSSTPISRGGPCLKQTEATYASASSTVRSTRAGATGSCRGRGCRTGAGSAPSGPERKASVTSRRTLPAGHRQFRRSHRAALRSWAHPAIPHAP